MQKTTVFEDSPYYITSRKKLFFLEKYAVLLQV